MTEFSDGTVMTGTDIKKFRAAIADKLSELHQMTWRKVIVVTVKGKYRSQFTDDDDQFHGILDIIWAIRYVAKGQRDTLWKNSLDDKYTQRHHNVGSCGVAGDKVRILPWTQQLEDFLVATVAAMDAMGARVEAFFTAEDLEHRIQAASAQKLLTQD